MKISALLSIAALIVAVIADPIPAEDQVAAAPQIFDEITPYLSSASDVEKRQAAVDSADELVAAAGLIFNEVIPLSDVDEASEVESHSLEKRAVRPG
ncbi:hypothetical protein BGZ93_002302 [Podila epicladia]|nr:hypothetical protein BGZ92_007245 [Podila epicladia]KAG0097638.1 hypothetical protein BGZ93_002302 [Podila epicladia]